MRDGERSVLVETDIGVFFPLTLCQHYGVRGEHYVPFDSLAVVGLDDADIDVMLFIHLCFDHAGDLLTVWEKGQPVRLLFPNAHFVSSRRYWQRTRQPHLHDRVSFVPELLDLLRANGCLELLDDGERSVHPSKGQRFHLSEGHTPGQMLPEIAMSNSPVVFSDDLIPGAPWAYLPLTMGYDRFPEGLIEEKEHLLGSLTARNGRLAFTHDLCVAMDRARRDEQERYSLYDTLEWVENLEA